MIETATELFASATFIWVVIIGVVIAMSILIENELEGWATTLFSVGLALILWNFKGDIWSFISTNPKTTIGFSLSYILIGIAWSFLKWRTYVKEIFDLFKKIRKDFLSSAKEGDIKDIKYFLNKINSSRLTEKNLYSDNNKTIEDIIDSITPQASNKKSLIVSWISYWPMSLSATLLNNPFRKFFEWIYDNLSGYYDKITNSYKQDLLK